MWIPHRPKGKYFGLRIPRLALHDVAHRGRAASKLGGDGFVPDYAWLVHRPYGFNLRVGKFGAMVIFASDAIDASKIVIIGVLRGPVVNARCRFRAARAVH